MYHSELNFFTIKNDLNLLYFVRFVAIFCITLMGGFKLYYKFFSATAVIK